MTEGVAFMDLRRRDCRFPLGERDEPPTLFCGEPARAGSPYCQHHHRIAYVPATKRRPPQDRQTTDRNAVEWRDRVGATARA